ncbi:MAG: adenosine deaminase [Candidatus Thorarchaeota archaeon]|nr:MAG: adenosine deaminase [Candidatus Thorarchaeota archaeon]
MEIEQTIRNLPKVELHIHTVGSIRPGTLLAVMDDGEIDVTYESVKDIERLFRYRDFTHFISIYSQVVDYITRESHFERIIFEMLEDCVKCNVHYVEASFSAFDHIERGMEFSAMINALNRGIRKAKKQFGVESNIRIDLVRNAGPDAGMSVLDLIEEKPDNIVSIDIGGSEEKVPPRPFAQVYERAKKMGLHLVAHAGEAAGPQSIWDAVNHLNVERIGHGVTAREDPELMNFLKKKQVAIEMCPVSNVRTGVVSDIATHPIRDFFDFGLLVTVNSDDPSFFHTDLNNEFIQLHRHLGFSIDELFQISLNSIEVSFLPEERKAQLRDSFKDEYERLKPL